VNNKAIIVSAPSGAGKTTLVRHLLGEFPQLEFSISACSRPKRSNETDGTDYYFISADEFRKRIANDEFVEWQEVYPESYYGTMKSELERIWSNKRFPIFDVDVYGGLNLKKYFGAMALALFIQPPSVNDLEQRLKNRGSENEEKLKERLRKAGEELTAARKFDKVIINDSVEKACEEIKKLVSIFLGL
jgi:guanylate kinase